MIRTNLHDVLNILVILCRRFFHQFYNDANCNHWDEYSILIFLNQVWLIITSFVRIARKCAERFYQTFSRSRRAAAQNEWDSSSSNRTNSFFLHSDFDYRISWKSSFQFVRTMRTKAKSLREMLWFKCSEKKSVC